jgi:predicted nucleotidyltransferase
VQEAYLYGSFARNQQDSASDIDVLVVGNPKGGALAEEMRKLERRLGREISSSAEGIRVAPRSEGCLPGKRLAQ